MVQLVTTTIFGGRGQASAESYRVLRKSISQNGLDRLP